MNEIMNNNVVTMSSREIAVLTGKEHYNVLRDIEKMLNELNLVALNFEGSYIAENSKYADKGYASIKQTELDSGRIVYNRRFTNEGREFILDLLKGE